MSLILPLIGIAMIIAKYFEAPYLVDLDWWWCGIPFVLAFLYWEFVDGMFHISAKMGSKKFDKKRKKLREKQIEEELSGDGAFKLQGRRGKSRDRKK